MPKINVKHIAGRPKQIQTKVDKPKITVSKLAKDVEKNDRLYMQIMNSIFKKLNYLETKCNRLESELNEQSKRIQFNSDWVDIVCIDNEHLEHKLLFTMTAVAILLALAISIVIIAVV